MKKQFQLLPFTLIFLLFACNNPDAFDCLKTTGDTAIVDLDLELFQHIMVYDGIEVHLKMGEEQKVRLSAGANIIQSINYSIEENVLTLRDNNSCKWVRNYQSPVVEITSNQLLGVKSSGYGLVKSLDTLYYNNFEIESADGTGDFELILALDRLRVISNNLANISITGTANSLSVGYWYNDGKFDGTQLNCNTVKLEQNGSNTIKVNANEAITGRITGRGSVLYTGDPSIIDVQISGSGKLIKN